MRFARTLWQTCDRLLLAAALTLVAARVAVASTPGEKPLPAGAKSANSPDNRLPATHGAEWEVIFPDEITMDEYARQMDYFRVEIAAVSKNGKVEYISKVSQRRPEKRVGNRATDYRLHIGWKNGNLHAVDRKLLAKAEINSQNKDLWHYFPIDLQAQLSNLERAYAQRDPAQIKRTRFEIHPRTRGGGYEFVVVEQDPPRPSQATRSPGSQNQPTRPD